MKQFIPKFQLFSFLHRQGLNYILQDEQQLQSESTHYPVMHENILRFIKKRSENQNKISLIDCTIGTGAHSQILLKNIPNLNILGLDLDPRMIQMAQERLIEFHDRLQLKHANFNNIDLSAKYDIIFADLGYNIVQVMQSGYGLSYRDASSKLDMRYNNTQGLSASDLLNKFSSQEIYEFLIKYGNVKQASKITQQIIKERENNTIQYVGQLINACMISGQEKQIPQVFQALRIVVNQEIQCLERLLERVKNCKQEIIALIITFHSLESDTIRQFARANRRQLRIIQEEVPSAEEIIQNPRSRSAKLFYIQIEPRK